ncbi:hypothetical protein F3526_25175 [Vibrio parahaemolyticus]|nr:hypothetical protein [Vibrio parahaemolyticus]EGR3462177.1 hypothetical protein [Vibrio parahaemolyticus]TBT62265.1 hypothetical protein D5E73_23820 [Vibrio parahaemolyticus]TBT71347.1 hypothetical protein D5E72_23910 [Vibrio parahaemolyticus]
MFNHIKSVACIFSLLPKVIMFWSFSKLVSFDAVFRTFSSIFKLELQFLCFLFSKFNLVNFMI